MSVPTVSVLMPAYNHASFVKAAIISVLDQDFEDFELLISDDASPDDTVSIIESINDPRIKLFRNSANRGAATVHNELLSRARAKYVALINSDDVWLPGKLSRQVAFLESNIEVGATFGRARFVDRQNNIIPKRDLPFGNVFDQDNRTQGGWLRHFFERGNCLCHPTILARREVYEALGPYDVRLRQLPDFEMWVRLVKAYPIFVHKEDMIAFRILPGENESSGTVDNTVRTINEHYFIAKSMFDNVASEIFRDGFSDILVRKDFQSDIEFAIEKSLVFKKDVETLSGVYQLVAVEKLYELLQDAEAREVLASRYEFRPTDFHKLSSRYSALYNAAFTRSFSKPVSSSLSDLSGVRFRALLAEVADRVVYRGRRAVSKRLSRN